MACNIDSLCCLLAFKSLILKYKVEQMFKPEESTEASEAEPEDYKGRIVSSGSRKTLFMSVVAVNIESAKGSCSS